MFHDVFICYAPADATFARYIYDSVRASGLTVSPDWENIPRQLNEIPGSYPAIEGADAILFVITPASLQSEIWHRQLGYAIWNRKHVIPILCQDVETEPDQLDSAIAAIWAGRDWEALARANWQFLKAFPWHFLRPSIDSIAASFAKLRDALKTSNPQRRAHTQLLVRACYWQRNHRKGNLLLAPFAVRDAEQWVKASENELQKPTSLQLEYIRASQLAASGLALPKSDNSRAIIIVAMVLGALLLCLLVAVLGSSGNDDHAFTTGPRFPTPIPNLFITSVFRTIYPPAISVATLPSVTRTPINVGELTVGQPVTGTVYSGPVEWSLEGITGQAITIHFSAFGMKVSVYDPNNRLLASSTGSPIGPITLSNSGIYRVVVERDTAQGPYVLWVGQ